MRGSDYQTVRVDTKQWDKLNIDLEYTNLAKKFVKKELKTALKEARKQTAKELKTIVGTTGKNPQGDKRGAAKAVKMATYKKGDGGNISILDKKGQAKGMKLYEPRRGGKSGILRNRHRSKKTTEKMSYRGADRAFVLRFLDRGTETRYTTGQITYTGKAHRKKGWQPTPKEAKRGSIAAGNFFGPIAKSNIDEEATKLSMRILKLIEEVATK